MRATIGKGSLAHATRAACSAAAAAGARRAARAMFRGASRRGPRVRRAAASLAGSEARAISGGPHARAADAPPP